MLDRGLNPCVMNLADAYTACGMYKRGSRAQEEGLCRASTLSRSLFQFFKAKSYPKNVYAVEANVEIKFEAYPMDMNFGGIYSPGVTVFRNSEDLYSLSEEPYKVGIVSVAALFDEILKEPEFKNKFKEVVFAILDKDGEKGKFVPFYKMFN